MGTNNSQLLNATYKFGNQLRHNDLLHNPASLAALIALPFVANSTANHIRLNPHPKRTKELTHPTLIFPGITKKGKDMTLFRDELRSKHVAAHIWGPDRNVGPTRFTVNKLHNLLNHFCDDAGEAAYLVGYSFGGLMCLYLARQLPANVKAAFIISSPDLLSYEDIPHKTIFANIFRYIEHAGFLFDQKILRNWIGEHLRPPLEIPIIAFVACNDKTVSAPSCEAPISALNRTFYIECDHTEIKTHKGVVAAIAYLQEHGLYAELPEEILATGFVARENMIDHFLAIEHPPLINEAGVLSLTSS